MERYIPAARRPANRPEETQESPAEPRKSLLRIRPAEPEPSPAKPKPPEWHKAYLVPALLKHPPIRRRGDPAEVGLTPPEFALGGTALIVARYKTTNKCLAKYRWDKGQWAIKGARNKNMKPELTNRKFFQRVGSQAYHKAKSTFSRPRELVIYISQRELLKASGWSYSAPTRHRLPAALDRLMQPVNADFPPLLLSHGKAEDGRLCLRVNMAWVPKGGFDLVPWPPPGAPIVLRLYLFIFGTDQRGNTTISFENLYERLGIPPRHGWRTLCRALFLVNEHLAWLNREGMLKKPNKFELAVSRDGRRVHITKVVPKEAEPAEPQAETDIADARRAM